MTMIDESWLPTLNTDTPGEGFELGAKLARLAVMVSQSEADQRGGFSFLAARSAGNPGQETFSAGRPPIGGRTSRPLDGLRKGNARLSQFRHRLDGNADQDRHAVREELDGHEVLQRLEPAVAVQGAAVVKLNTRSRLAEAFVLDVLLHPRLLRWRQMAVDYSPGRGFASRKNGHGTS
jgi:hypothetical protein